MSISNMDNNKSINDLISAQHLTFHDLGGASGDYSHAGSPRNSIYIANGDHPQCQFLSFHIAEVLAHKRPWRSETLYRNGAAVARVDRWQLAMLHP